MYPDCSSDPVFVSEEIATAENIPEDTIIDCDCFVPEDNMSAETESVPNPCDSCYEEREHCGHKPDQNGHCDYYDLEEDEDEDEDIEEISDDDFSDPLDEEDYDTGLH